MTIKGGGGLAEQEISILWAGWALWWLSRSLASLFKEDVQGLLSTDLNRLHS